MLPEQGFHSLAIIIYLTLIIGEGVSKTCVIITMKLYMESHIESMFESLYQLSQKQSNFDLAYFQYHNLQYACVSAQFRLMLVRCTWVRDLLYIYIYIYIYI